MELLLVAVLDVIGVMATVLFVLGVPLFFGLLAYDVVDQNRRAAAAALVAPVRKTAPATPRVEGRRLTA